MKSDVFKKELELIKSDEIRDLVIRAFENVDDKFFVAPASSTGKYHPLFSLGNGGLKRHVQAAVFFFYEITKLEQYSEQFTDEEIDCGIGALLLHDSCKSGLTWDNKYTIHEHPVAVVDLLDYTDLNEEDTKLWKFINTLIACHMGQWNTDSRSTTILPKPNSILEELVHLSDYLASRKQIANLTIFDESELSEVPEERHIVSWKDDPATAKQAKMIRKLLDAGLEKEVLTDEFVVEIRTQLKNDELKKGAASTLIDRLIKEVEGDK